MDFNLTTEQQQIREEIRKVCKEFPDAYWREIDSKKAYPEAFVHKLSELGWLAALIPEEFGGNVIYRRSPRASCACKLSASPNLMPVRKAQEFKRPPSVVATST